MKRCEVCKPSIKYDWNLYSGKCSVCGYVLPCQHKNKTVTIDLKHWLIRESCNDCGENRHKAIA